MCFDNYVPHSLIPAASLTMFWLGSFPLLPHFDLSHPDILISGDLGHFRYTTQRLCAKNHPASIRFIYNSMGWTKMRLLASILFYKLIFRTAK